MFYSTRRQFLLSAGASVIGPRFVRAQQRPPHILVAGAGLSGLSAAYQLAKAGSRVTLIEGRMRHGGRVFTMREPFAEGLYAETGGEVAGNGYKRFLAYCNEFGVATDEVSGEAGRGLATLMKGKLYQPGVPITGNPYQLSGEEATLAPPTLLARHLRAMAEEVATDPSKLAEFDKLSLADVLRARGASKPAIDLMEMSLNYNDIETVSAGGVLWETRRRAGAGAKVVRVRGGNSRLTDALVAAATRAGVTFIYGAILSRVVHTEKGVRLIAKVNQGKTETFEGDALVCTLPAGPLREVTFDPVLPEAKARAIRELPYTQVTKIWLQARRAAWDAAGYGGGVWTDTELERVMSLMPDVKSARGIFIVWLDGKGTISTAAMTNEERLSWARRGLATHLPNFAKDIEGGTSVVWATDKLARGAYAHFAKGQLISIRPHLAASVGRIYFAGEHTAEISPGMEGALESAERVVSEILGRGLGR